MPSELPETQRTRMPLRTLVAWLVIGAMVGLIVFQSHLPIKRAAAPAETGLPASTTLLLVSRSSVGIKSTSFGKDAAGPLAAQIMAQVNLPPISHLDQLRAIPVLVELGDWEGARSLFTQVKQSPNAEKYALDLAAFEQIYANGFEFAATTGPATLPASTTSRPATLPVFGAISQAQADQLVERHGWFGRLAWSHAANAPSEVGIAVQLAAQRTAYSVIAIEGGGFIGVIVGLGLSIVLIVLFANRMLVRRFVPLPGDPPYFLEAFALYLVLWTGGGIAVQLLLPRASLMAYALLVPLVIFAACWPKICGMSWANLARGLGWIRAGNFAKEVVCGVAGWVAVLPALAVAFALTYLLASKTSGRLPSHPLMDELPKAGVGDLFGLIALASVMAPVLEETMFRGAFYHHLRRRWAWWIAAPVVAFIFAAIHPQGLLGIPVLMVIAIQLALLREWRGSLIAPMTAHALNNLIGVLIMWTMLR